MTTTEPRPAFRAYDAHITNCWACTHGFWCAERDRLDFDADVEAHRLAERRRMRAA